jgi:hypothetical protein
MRLEFARLAGQLYCNGYRKIWLGYFYLNHDTILINLNIFLDLSNLLLESLPCKTRR